PQGRGPAECRSCSFSDTRLVLHPLNQQYCAAKSHPDQKSVNLSSQQQTQLGKVAVYPDSKEDVGQILAAEPREQDGNDCELRQDYAVEQFYESFRISWHNWGLRRIPSISLINSAACA